jgi:hypothetical protein
MPQERLNDDDITNLVTEMLDLASSHPNAPFTRVFTMAQEKVLPPHKRYRKTVIQQRTKWSKRLQEALKGAGLWPGYQPPEDPAPSPPVATPAPTAAPVVVQAPKPPAPVVGEEPTPSQVSAASLAQKLVESVYADLWKRIAPEINRQVEVRLEAILARAEIEGSEPEVHPEDTDKIIHVIEHKAMPVSCRRIFVIGLLPEQILVLRKKLAGVEVELRFWKNEAQTKLTENAEWADDIFLMTKFVSHSDIHAVRNKGREKVKYCNGAVSELERQIRFTIPESVVA